MNLISGRITKHFNKTWLHITSCTVHTSGTQNEASSADMIIQRHTYYKQEKAIRRMNLLFVFKVPITSSSSFIAMNISCKTFSPILNSVLMQHGKHKAYQSRNQNSVQQSTLSEKIQLVTNESNSFSIISTGKYIINPHY